MRTRFIVLLALSSLSAAQAQQAQQNINVLPVAPQYSNAPCRLDLDGIGGVNDVYLENGQVLLDSAEAETLVDCVEDPSWYLRGDGFANRQVEPTIAASTRNPNHLIAFFNDYRAVDIPNDPEPTGLADKDAEDSDVADPTAIELAQAEPEVQKSAPVAASEAFIGASFSYDLGVTWSGGFLPGGPEDDSPASLASPLKGLEAGTDPVAVSMPCGIVHVVGIAFTRGDESKIFFSTYQDTNDSAVDHTWRYLGTTVLESGNNAENGVFLDKPDAAGDVVRDGSSSDPCAHNLYVSYTTFNGQSTNGSIQTKVNFTKVAMDSSITTSYPAGGIPFATQRIDQPFNQGQGTAIAVDPGDGAVYVAWRHFFSPDAILVHKSTDYGASFPGKPKDITKSVVLENFDQPSISSVATGAPLDDVAFRSNGFPDAVVTDDGTLFVAWQERVDVASGPGSGSFGHPDPNGSPRIVMMRSNGNLNSFESVEGVSGDRVAVDFGDRDVGCDFPATSDGCPEPGFGLLPQERASGPQVMPKLGFGAGQLMLTYYESRGLADFTTDTIAEIDLSTNGFIAGYRRLLDLRAAVLDPATGQLISTTQVSRYPIAPEADLSDGETLEDVVRTCNFEGTSCVPAVHRANLVQSGGGMIAFIGDYNGLIPAVDFVVDDATRGWRWATEPGDVPSQGFRAIWSDNRNVAEPAGDPSTAIFEFQNYGPPGVGGACLNPGSRNTDVYTARIDTEVLVSTPTTYKSLANQARTFPFSLTNTTGDTVFYRLAITTGSQFASLRPLDEVDVQSEPVALLPYSSTSRVVYADGALALDSDDPGPIRVNVYALNCDPEQLYVPCAEDPVLGCVDPDYVCPDGPLVGAAVFNSDPTNPADQSGESAAPLVSNPLVSNPLVSNPLVSNPLVSNISASNPLVSNPLVSNPLVSNASPDDVIDVTWTVQANPASTDTSFSLLPILNIDNAEAFLENYDFQLVLYRTSSFGALNAEACAAYGASQDQVISVVSTNQTATPLVSNPLVSNPLVSNPLVSNPLVSNPLVSNPLVSNPLVSNSAFTVGPSDATAASGARTVATRMAGGDTRRPRANDVVNVLLRAIKKPGAPDDLPFVFNPNIDPPSLTLLRSDCDPQVDLDCLLTTAPDLEPGFVPELSESVSPGVPFDFPPLQGDLDNDGFADAWALLNNGKNPATAENRELRHGFYLSVDTELDLQPNGQLVPCEAGEIEGFDCDALVGTIVSTRNPLPGGELEAFGPTELLLPTGLPGGNYNLILRVDDLEEVSEFDEVNNYRTLEAIVPLSVISNSPPSALAASFELKENDGAQPAFEGALAATDTEADTVTFELVGDDDGDGVLETANGTVTLVGDPVQLVGPSGEVSVGFEYVPVDFYSGPDSFSFRVSDEESETSEATVDLDVLAVNYPPSLPGGVTLVLPGVEEPLPGETTQSEGILSAENDEGDVIFAILTTPTFGTAMFDSSLACPASLLAEFPDALCSAGSPQACPPDSPPNLVCAAVTITYEPDSDTEAPPEGLLDTFVFRVFESDDSGEPTMVCGESGTEPCSVDGNVEVEIEFVDDAPIAYDQAFAVAEDGSLTIDLSSIAPPAAVEPDGQALGPWSLVSGPVCVVPSAGCAAGVLDFGANGAFSYSAAPDAFGIVTFQFKVKDENGNDSNVATVTIDVQAVNDAPLAVPTAVTVEQNSSGNQLALSGTDIDVGDALTFAIEGAGSAFGSLANLTPQPPFQATVDYTPINGFVGEDSFVFSVTDLAGAVSTATVSITVEDPFPDDCFIGLLDPYPFPYDPVAETYSVRRGSSVPLKWQYADFTVRWPPQCGAPKDTGFLFNQEDPQSSPFMVEITGPYSPQGRTCDPASEVGASFVITPASPGNSTFKYSGGSATHQLNWDSSIDQSGNSLPRGCYNVRVKRSDTGQVDGPYPIRLR